jgi:hypothetical protein
MLDFLNRVQGCGRRCAQPWLWFLLIFVSVMTCGRASAAQAEAAPVSVSDMTVVPEKGGAASLYIADARKGAIYFSRLERGAPPGLELSRFRQLFRCADYPKPVALAYLEGKLFVYDLDTSDVLRIDPSNSALDTPGCQAEKVVDGGKIKTLLQGGTLTEPVSLALKRGKETAPAEGRSGAALEIIISGGAGQIVRFDQSSDTARLVPAATSVGSPVRTAFSTDAVVILNEGGQLFSLARADAAQPEAGQGTSRINLPAQFEAAGSRLKDLVVYRGIYYGINQKQVVVFPEGGADGRAAESVHTIEVGDVAPVRMAVTADRLFFADAASNSVRSLPRPVPVTLSLENELKESTRAQVALYRYLQKHGLLPYRVITAKRQYTRLEPLLVEEQVPLAGFQSRWGNDIQGDFPDIAAMAELICEINSWGGCAGDRSSRANGGTPKLKVEQGQKVLLPDVPLRAILKTSMVSVEKKIGDLVNERVLLPEHKAQASEAYVASKNDYESKPDGPRLFEVSKGDFYLPATIWHLDVLVNSADLRDESSAFRREVTIIEKVYAFSKEPLNSSGNASPAPRRLPQDVPAAPCGGSLEEQLECLRSARLRLKTAIRYTVPPLGEYSGEEAAVKIGLLEKAGGVPPHPDLTSDEGESAWFIPAPTGCNVGTGECRLLVRAAPPGETDTSPTQPPSLLVPDPRKEREHGVFIAGLIAARRRGSVDLRGLLPNMGLFLIDIDNVTPDGLNQAVDFAAGQEIVVFNLSSEFKDNSCDPLDEEQGCSSTLTDVKKKMRDREGILWVVAAGDQNQDLRDDGGEENVPISWSFAEVKNMIGVGASDYDGNFTKVWPLGGDPATRKADVSNFSKKHVHLIAPGVEVFSTASGGRYAMWHGSSFAAPQVTAAAAMLVAQKIRNPKQLKARLIYTSTWDDRYLGEAQPDRAPKGDLWGGMLNYERAVWHPGKNLVESEGNAARFAVTVEGNPEIVVTGGMSYDLNDDGELPLGEEGEGRKLTIPFKKILRIQRYGTNGAASGPEGARFVRVIYLNDLGQLRVIHKAELEDKVIQFSAVEMYDEAGKKFIPTDQALRTDTGRQERRVSQITDYVAATPGSDALGKRGRSPWN